MNDTIASWIAVGVEVLITSVLISALVAIMTASQTVTAGVLEQDAMAAEMREYREWNQYDGKHVYMQDIVTVTLKWKGQPYTEVRGLTGGTLVWNLSGTSATLYTSVKVSEKLDVTCRYHSTLHKSVNGETLGFIFTKCTGGAACSWSG